MRSGDWHDFFCSSAVIACVCRQCFSPGTCCEKAEGDWWSILTVRRPGPCKASANREHPNLPVTPRRQLLTPIWEQMCPSDEGLKWNECLCLTVVDADCNSRSLQCYNPREYRTGHSPGRVGVWLAPGVRSAPSAFVVSDYGSLVASHVVRVFFTRVLRKFLGSTKLSTVVIWLRALSGSLAARRSVSEN